MGTPIRKAPALILAVALVALGAAAFAGAFEDALADFERAWKGADYQAKVAAVERLVATGETRALEVVVERALVADDQFVFERAVDALKTKTDERGRDWLAEKAKSHASADVRVVLVRMCGSLEAKGAVEAIAAALKDAQWTVRVAGVRAARERRVKELVPGLVALVAGEDGRVREDAVEALRDLTGADYGRDGKKWAEWWAGAGAGFELKPAAAPADPSSDDPAAAPPAQNKDLETITREGLYEIRSKRTLFILDVSASMEAKTAKGTRLDFVKKELKRVLAGFEKDMSFNFVLFSDKARLWKPKMVRAGAERSAATRMVEGLKPDGQTATYEALKLAFTLDDVDTIWLLSDGFPTVGSITSEELIKTEVRKLNRTKNIAIHTIAFVAGELKGETEDKARAKQFMQELAAQNYGGCKVVE